MAEVIEPKKNKTGDLSPAFRDGLEDSTSLIELNDTSRKLIEQLHSWNEGAREMVAKARATPKKLIAEKFISNATPFMWRRFIAEGIDHDPRTQFAAGTLFIKRQEEIEALAWFLLAAKAGLPEALVQQTILEQKLGEEGLRAARARVEVLLGDIEIVKKRRLLSRDCASQ